MNTADEPNADLLAADYLDKRLDESLRRLTWRFTLISAAASGVIVVSVWLMLKAALGAGG